MKRRTLIGIVVGAAVLAAGGIAAWWLVDRARGPEAVAADFLSALEAGDGYAALALMTGGPADDPDSRAVHAAATLPSADEWISAAQLDGVERSGPGEATASFSFDLEGARRTAEMSLDEDASGWRIGADALGSLTVSTTIGDTVGVGTRLSAVDEPIALFPAAYTVSAAPAAALGGAASIAVMPGAETTADIVAEVRPEAVALAQESLDEYADDCAATSPGIPEHCGIRVPWAADLASLTRIAFRIEQYPVVQLADDARTFTAADGVLVATATGTAQSGGSAAFTYRTTTWTLRGDLTFDGGEMTLAVR